MCEASPYKNPLPKTAGRRPASISEGSKDPGRSIVHTAENEGKATIHRPENTFHTYVTSHGLATAISLGSNN